MELCKPFRMILPQTYDYICMAIEQSISRKFQVLQQLEHTIGKVKTGMRKFMQFDPYTLADLPDDAPDMSVEAKMQIGTGARLSELIMRRNSSVQVNQNE